MFDVRRVPRWSVFDLQFEKFLSSLFDDILERWCTMSYVLCSLDYTSTRLPYYSTITKLVIMDVLYVCA